MSQYDSNKAAALKYDGNNAPVVVAAGTGYVAQKIVEVAESKDIPVYEDNSLATLLSQLRCGTEIPPELYQAVVDIYVYFLNYNEKKLEQAQKNSVEKSGRTLLNDENKTEEEIQ